MLKGSSLSVSYTHLEKLFSRPLVPGSQQAYNDIASKLEEILSNPDSDVKAEMEAFAPQFKADFEK